MAHDGNTVHVSAPDHSWRPAQPASSTLAAHLAPHLASQGPDTHRLTRQTFSQLRQELLSERHNQLRVDETVTDVNKLICIILKAGLEPRSGDGPPEEDFEGQVLDCLDIIQASIDKAPQALWDSADPLILSVDVPAPLFAWLILRLIRLTNSWRSDVMQERIRHIFTSILYAQSKQFRPLSSSSGASAFLCACTSG